jgi:FMN phosphatase YigB (HAD superfamily)
VPLTENPIRAVLFDFAGTLFAPQSAPLQVLRASARLGLALSHSECERLGAEFLRAGMPGGPYPDSIPAEIAADYARRDLDPEAHRAAYIALMSAVSAPSGLAQACYESVLVADGWVPYSDTEATLEALRGRGLALGLVSNAGFDLRPILDAHGQVELARHATLSFEQGAVKPSPAIFRAALATLDAAPTQTLMVGDHPEADGGAAALGITTLILPMSAPGARHGLARVIEAIGSGTSSSLQLPPRGQS